MRVLVAGLGSMGKRRVRNLLALEVETIVGVDPRQDRREEAASEYGIAVHADLEEALTAFRPDALIVSTPPDRHMDVAERAVRTGMPCFIEASVVDAERILALHEATHSSGPIIAPSCTMRYFPGPTKAREVILSGKIGTPLSFTYQTGQYLKDWHPWEPIESYYVSKRATGGCREIVPFELTWLNPLFGKPKPISCVKKRLGDLGVDIDDIYHVVLEYPGEVLGTITVDVLTRPKASRELRVIGSTGQLVMSADENVVRFASISCPEWTRLPLDKGSVHSGYINPEEPYIRELGDFLVAVSSGRREAFPNTLIEDYEILRLLEKLEQLSD